LALNEELMQSKSEVIVANTLRSLGIEYSHEELLRMPDGSIREPDFTIRPPGQPTVYWEHLGMLDRAGYRADWEAKLGWYAKHGILPWTKAADPLARSCGQPRGKAAAAGSTRTRSSSSQSRYSAETTKGPTSRSRPA
jgi:hypothetical protein